MPRLVCEHCGYDLSGLGPAGNEVQCPECGRFVTIGRQTRWTTGWYKAVAWSIAPTAALALFTLVISPEGLGSAAHTGVLLGLCIVMIATTLAVPALMARRWRSSHDGIENARGEAFGIWAIGLVVGIVATLVVVGVVFLRSIWM